jgi:hypothetical protein
MIPFLTEATHYFLLLSILTVCGLPSLAFNDYQRLLPQRAKV